MLTVAEHKIRQTDFAKFEMEVDRFLLRTGFLPFQRWNRFHILHPTRPPSRKEQRKQKATIREKVGEKCGVYAYLTLTGELLYFGKGNPLLTRIYRHYTESFRHARNDDKAVAWHIFFRRYSGELVVHWMELIDDHHQRIIEEMMEYFLRSQFDVEFPRGKRTATSHPLLKRARAKH